MGMEITAMPLIQVQAAPQYAQLQNLQSKTTSDEIVTSSSRSSSTTISSFTDSMVHMLSEP